MKYDKTGTSTDDNPIKEPEMIKEELLSTSKNGIITLVHVQRQSLEQQEAEI